VSDQINIGQLTSGITVVGGQGATVSGSGTASTAPAGISDLDGLRGGLSRLVQLLASDQALGGLLGPAEAARAEAARPEPEPGRIRRLLAAVLSGAQGVTTVTAAAADVTELAGHLARMIG
jgi:hypothetical protein